MCLHYSLGCYLDEWPVHALSQLDGCNWTSDCQAPGQVPSPTDHLVKCHLKFGDNFRQLELANCAKFLIFVNGTWPRRNWVALGQVVMALGQVVALTALQKWPILGAVSQGGYPCTTMDQMWCLLYMLIIIGPTDEGSGTLMTNLCNSDWLRELREIHSPWCEKNIIYT